MVLRFLTLFEIFRTPRFLYLLLMTIIFFIHTTDLPENHPYSEWSFPVKILLLLLLLLLFIIVIVIIIIIIIIVVVVIIIIVNITMCSCSCSCS